MSVPPPRTSPDLHSGMVRYAERLDELLDACAQDRGQDPERFLWNARRALEVICHLALTAHRGTVSRFEDGIGGDGSLNWMIGELAKQKLLSREDKTRFNAAREQSNLGVHIRQPEREDYRKACEDLAHLLPGIVDWLFDESPAKGDLLRSDRLVNALIDIRAGGRAARAAEPTLTVTQATLPAAPPAQVHPRSPLPWMVGAAGLVLACAAGVATLRGGVEGESPLGENVVATLRAAPSEPSQAEVEADDAAMVEPAPEARAAPPADCPEGMVLVDTTILRLGQPVGGRGGWPKPRSARLGPQQVAAFCIDATARTRSSFEAWSNEVGMTGTNCDQPREAEAGDPPATCVKREQARRYCEQAVPGGRLPTLLEWEAVARSTAEVTKVAPGAVREWASDAFPPASLNLHAETPSPVLEGMFRQNLLDGVEPEGNVLYSWNRQDLSKRWSNLGFRCATTPVEQR